jgi:hypothetical protein
MTDRAAARLAWSLTVAYGVCAVAAIVVSARNGTFQESLIAFPLAIGGLAVVGGLLSAQRPRNPIGWLMLSVPLAAGFWFLADQLAVYGFVTAPGSLPLDEFIAWLDMWLGNSMLLPLVFVVFLFPSGRLPSPAWRPVAWGVGVLFAFVTLIFAFGMPKHSEYPQIVNPYALPALLPVFEALQAAFVIYIFVLGLAVASLIARYRTASPTEKQQLKWIVLAGIVMVASLLLTQIPSPVTESSWLFAILALPVATAIAILRHRLYDIDLLIKRTIVYAAVTAALAATFFAGLVLLQAVLRPLTNANELGVAASTLLSFALFQPIRRGIHSFVDRRFDRHKYDAERTLEAFSTRLREEIDLDALRGDLVAAVGTTMAPAHVSLWLREAGP